jgi:hypothetical protein
MIRLCHAVGEEDRRRPPREAEEQERERDQKRGREPVWSARWATSQDYKDSRLSV